MGALCDAVPDEGEGVVHVVDDDVSVRGALEALFETVGLETQTYGAAADFLTASLPDRPGASSSTSACLI